MDTKDEYLEEVKETNYVVHGNTQGDAIPTREMAMAISASTHPNTSRGAMHINLAYPPCSVKFQATGRVCVMGGKSRGQVLLAMTKVLALCSMHCGRRVALVAPGIRTDNVVCSGQTHPVNLHLLAELFPGAVDYDPKSFKHAASVRVAATGYKDKGTRVKIQIFWSGKCNIPGGSSKEEARDAMEFCERELFSKAWTHAHGATRPIERASGTGMGNQCIVRARAERAGLLVETARAAVDELEAASVMVDPIWD
jgi:TATA-box binding protein (TBP) (component of TFIID and TFIIIB)